MVRTSGATGASEITASCSSVSLPNGTGFMPFTISKLLPRSAKDWRSALPTSGSSAGLENRLGGLTFAETPLARSPDSTGAPSHLKRGAVQSAWEDDSSFSANLEQSI
jgi:hypothetical protein